MKKYSKDIIMDYINGEDILDYDISLLEDDVNFMEQVIEETNDKNMYYMCGDNLKKNLKFITYLINKFHNDIKFIEMISNDYMKEASETEQIELKIILCNVLGNIDDDYVMSLGISLAAFYIKNKAMYEIVLDELNMKNSLGFSIVLSDYNQSDIIKKYFAKRMINEIFPFSMIEFERLLHLKFKVKSNISKMGINNFLINYVFGYDKCLSGYLAVHIDLLTELYGQVSKILSRWDQYEKARNKDKMDAILYEIDKFVGQNEFFWGKELQIYKYLIIRLNLTSNIDLKYFDKEFNGSIEDIENLNISALDVDSYRKFEKFWLGMKNFYYFDIEPDDYLDNEDNMKKKKVPGKVLKLEIKN